MKRHRPPATAKSPLHQTQGKGAGGRAQLEHLTPLRCALPVSLLFRALLRGGAQRTRTGAGDRSAPVPSSSRQHHRGGTGKRRSCLVAAFIRNHGYIPHREPDSGSGAARTLGRIQTRCVGDEPVVLAQRSGSTVWVGADRVAAASALPTRIRVRCPAETTTTQH